MTIDNYTDDAKMAEYGRVCAKYKAIREAKEAIRDIAVALGNANDIDGINNLRKALNGHIDDLVEAMGLSLKNTCK